tara:strand:+ start:293 stop:538 length:246 start_codon:yes stop_codon:yes gene_type:complete
MVCDQCAGYELADDCPSCQREESRFDLLGVEEAVIEMMALVARGEIDHVDQLEDNLPNGLAGWQEDLVRGEILGKFPHLTE